MTGIEDKGKAQVEQGKRLAVLAENALSSSMIPRGLYDQFNVKRGLRNADGTGVLVGLTNIGNVHGYIINENEKVPVKGRLYYRGYDIRRLVEGFKIESRFGFEEVCYLLLFGSLPTADELRSFNELLGESRTLPDNFAEDVILKSPSSDIMNKLSRSVLVSYSYDAFPDDISIPNVMRQHMQMIARFPTMVAYGYQALRRYYQGKSLFLHNPKKELTTAQNLLRMIRPNAKFSHLEAEVLDLALVLHAEHGGGNNSAFTTHVVTSSGTDTYAALGAAVGSLKGPKHGGASMAVHGMFEDLKKNVRNWEDEGQIRDYLSKLLDGEVYDRKGLIYGMGHAVYTLSDPRAVMLKERAEVLARAKNRLDEFNLVAAVERLAPEVFCEKKGVSRPLCANVDLYSGVVYSMLDIPECLYTPLFAIARVPGWCAHRVEELISGGKVIRPAYKNVLPKRDYIPLYERE
ncbi:MAG: citrate/2-methylcitrate synthase [Kiritimatiellae bacterium]|nr:citrate/2-methylcitrate synthase [Kiritimatiellia bacterium]